MIKSSQMAPRLESEMSNPVKPPQATLRLAIIGCGPRGLQCLEALSRALSPEQLSRMDITVYDPNDKPGAGRIYDPTQPHVLKMNFATQHIDFWKTAADKTTPQSTSLIGLLNQHYPNIAARDQFVPRAIVGEYLHECFETVKQRLRRDAALTCLQRQVERVRRVDGRWQVYDGASTRMFDLVVLATGHEGLRASAPQSPQADDAFVFPVETNLSQQRIAAGTNVLVRGFGLTAIDAVLMLTEGRGGTFEEGEGLLPRYNRSSNEPRRIDIRSRSGRPMLAKPTATMEPISESFWIPYRERLDRLSAKHGELMFHQDIWSIITEAAGALLQQSSGMHEVRDVDKWFRGWSRYKMGPAEAKHAMLQSLAVARSSRPIDIPFALGESWRKLYAQLVSRISFGGLAEGQWECYLRTSREMERIAFGPPAENVAKLLRLIRDRVVTLGTSDQTAPNYDAMLHAVIASPTERDPGGPLAKLIAEGLVQVDPTTGAVRIGQDGFAVGSEHGLAIFGRATEGWIIGNDTLSRTLHPHIECWAKSVAEFLPTSAVDAPVLRTKATFA